MNAPLENDIPILRDGRTIIPRLTVRPPRPGDQAELEALEADLAAEGFAFAGTTDDAIRADFPAWLQSVADISCGINLPSEFVPAEFLIGVLEGTIVGRVMVRTELNPRLRQRGGHIGFMVGSRFRRRGYARQLLAHGLVRCYQAGIDHALITCADDNIASRRTIESYEAQLLDVIAAPDQPGKQERRYSVKTLRTVPLW